MDNITKMRVPYALALILILSADAAASVDVVLMQWKEPRHLGDINMSGWDAPRPESPSIREMVYLETIPSSLHADMYMLGSSFSPPPVTVNNITTTRLCHSQQNTWLQCNITIPLTDWHKGTNILNISAIYWWVGAHYGDFMIKDFRLTAVYPVYEPRVIAEKTQSEYETRLGRRVNVTIVLTNIGVKPAFNVSFEDRKPEGSYLVSGKTGGRIDFLSGEGIALFKYAIVPQETGAYNSENGIFRYYTHNWTVSEGLIEPTRLEVKPPIPQIWAYKSISPATPSVLSPVKVTVTLANNGTTPAYVIEAYDHIPNGFILEGGSPNGTIAILEPSENASYTYDIMPEESGESLASLDYRFLDVDGYQYNKSSDYAKISVAVPPTVVASARPWLMAMGVLAVVVVLSIVYWRISR
ncbi:MAG: hypothetical protein V1875_04180 [Candidatus Altiarchaeota archaeon]